MNHPPLFDSLTHPTLTGEWIGHEKSASLSSLLQQMQKNNIRWAFAVGIEEVGRYTPHAFSEQLAPYKGMLFPVAFYPYKEKESLENTKKTLDDFQRLGYYGIKLHPRIARIDLSHPTLAQVICMAQEMNMTVQLCTYMPGSQQPLVTMDGLATLLSRIHGARIILMHGCTVRILEGMELARTFSNVLLDVSFTLCKYAGSSLDLDLSFLFEHFDRRICIGSDFPEFSPKQLRERFEIFAKNLSEEKRNNIAYQNIFRFTGIQQNF